MAEQIDSNAPQEEPTTHNKRASFVALSLVLIVTFGLVIQSIMNYRSRTADKQEAVPTARAKAVPEPATTEDFAVEKARADRQLSFEQAKREEEERRNAALAAMGRTPEKAQQRAQTGTTSAAAAEEDPYKDVYQEFQRNEIKRVLEARQAGFRPERKDQQRTKRVSAAGNPNAPRGPLNQERERIALERERAARQRDELGQLGDQLNQRLTQLQDVSQFDANRAGLRPGSAPSTATASETTGQKVVGEPVANRAESGPRPGEVLLPTGTVMSGVLDMDMISDYDGPWRGLVVRDVYDVQKKFVLFPKGTRIVGRTLRVSNVNAPIQARMAMAVKWAILPNGNRIDFTKVVGLDAAGVAALKDQVNYHITAQLLGLTAFAVLGAAPGLAVEGSGDGFSSQQQALADLTGGMRDQFGSFAQKYLNLVPTITVRAGTPFKLFVEDDLYIKPWSLVDQTIYTSVN